VCLGPELVYKNEAADPHVHAIHGRSSCAVFVCCPKMHHLINGNRARVKHRRLNRILTTIYDFTAHETLVFVTFSSMHEQDQNNNIIIRLGQVRWSFVNVRKAFGNFRRARDYSDYRLDRIKGAAIADPETGSSPGNLLHLPVAMHSGRSATCSSQKI
jgi:hypothetical protein